VLEREKAEAKEGLLASLEIGKTLEGTVRSLQTFGAFVDLGGVDGLVHISQLSWDRLKHADEVLTVGQKIKVKILKIDPQTGKIALGFRDLSENPWEHVARDFPTRATAKGRVSRVTEFGAFVRLAPGVEGLVHISELSHKRVFRVTDVLTEGQEVEVLVLTVDTEQQRISLSLKALEARPTAATKEVEQEVEEPVAPVVPKKRKVPLQGGIGGPATGEKFGLKW
jgi:small subunit ribosomal protein S1